MGAGEGEGVERAVASALLLSAGVSEWDACALAVSKSKQEAAAEPKCSPECAGNGELESEGAVVGAPSALPLPAGASMVYENGLAVSKSEGKAPAEPEGGPECAGDGEPESVSAGEIEGAGGEVPPALKPAGGNPRALSQALCDAVGRSD